MSTFSGPLSAKGKCFGIVVARFNEFITRRLLQSAVETLQQAGVRENNIDIIWVPGALEIPYFIHQLSKRKKYDALIALACVIRGGTFHFECVSNEVTRGVSQASIDYGLPVASGIITADNLEQAIDRAGLKHGNKGGQAAMTALEIANLNGKLSIGRSKKNRKGHR